MGQFSARDWSWNTRDTISLVLGIPACALILTLPDAKELAYAWAAVLCVAAPLATRTLYGGLLGLAWCAGAALLKVPAMAAGGYLGLLVVRFGALLWRSRSSTPRSQ
ncbi:MAG TPA: hypothetical protein VEV17_21080 [Bryobacteraceae bacterium]|nr:hypothetical protein [Bryobacteraceae bacterium]